MILSPSLFPSAEPDVVSVIGIDPSLTGFAISDGRRHVAIATPAGEHVRTRVDSIRDALLEFVAGVKRGPRNVGAPLLWMVEAPMLNPRLAQHLYEVGWIMARVYDAALLAGDVEVVEVAAPVLKRFVTGKANASKIEMAVRVARKWDLEFADDAGANKVDAYCLWRYGMAVRAGDVTHVPPKRRGQGRDAQRRARKFKLR